jgi:hydroxymethylglutaryl-CoA lyase
MNQSISLIECPRDAMQGLHDFIPTNLKADYINQLLKVGFDTIDFGSFVSPKAIPQLRDTAEVLNMLHLNDKHSKLLAIIANTRGAADACHFEEIDFLGFPFSISETFQMRNTNSSIQESLIRVDEIQNLCVKHNKKLVIYISMAFGNPYGDAWNGDIAIEYTTQLHQKGIRIFAMSDTIGSSNHENITDLFSKFLHLKIVKLVRICTQHLKLEQKKLMLPFGQDAEDLMPLFMVLVVAPWQKMNSQETWPQRA